MQDYITIYDGYTTRDPTILKFCGGGSVPESTSSGPELLVEFTSSPYGTFSTTQPNVHSIFGFQIEVIFPAYRRAGLDWTSKVK